MKKKHILVVGGRDHHLDKIEKLGIRYSMLQIPDLVNKRQYSNAIRYAVLDYENLNEVLAIAKTWHSFDAFDGVVSFTEYGLLPASQCARELGISGNNLSAVQFTRDKIKMRNLLEEHGMSPVLYKVCNTMEDAQGFIQQVNGAPIVLKPYAGGLSEGVFFVDNEKQLEERWNWTRATTSGPILAEEFLTGQEYSVESISRNGKHEIVMITEKETTELPRFIELGHQAPARLDAKNHEQIQTLISDFLILIGQQTSPAHTEIRLTPLGPKIIESQTRIGGDQIWEMCEMVTGVDLMSETIATLVDLPLPPRTSIAKAAAIRFFSYENARILNVQNLDMAEKGKGVMRVNCSLKPGLNIGSLKSSDSRQGYVLCIGDSLDAAIANVETARDLVKVELEHTL